MKCKNCGAELEENWKFCPNCKNEIKVQEANEKEKNENNHFGVAIGTLLLCLQMILIFFKPESIDFVIFLMTIRIVFSIVSLLIMVMLRNKQSNRNYILNILIIIQIIYIVTILPTLLLRDLFENT